MDDDDGLQCCICILVGSDFRYKEDRQGRVHQREGEAYVLPLGAVLLNSFAFSIAALPERDKMDTVSRLNIEDVS